MRRFSLLGLAAAVIAFHGPEVRADQNQEKGLRIAMSCSAYARLKTAEYPETIKIYRDELEPKNKAEGERARIGLIWTNRVLFAGSIYGGHVFQQLHGRLPTNREISTLRAEWESLLSDALPSQKEAIGKNCHALFEAGDKYCAENPCLGRR